MGGVPDGATITKVGLKGTKSSGSETVYWYIEHEESSTVADKRFANPVTFNQFNSLIADTVWIVWIEGDSWSTVRNSSIKVYYTY